MTITEKIRRLKKRGGFTLVEVLCAVVIFTMLIAAVFAMFDPVNKISQMIKGDASAERIALVAETFMSTQFQTANGIEIYWMNDTDWADAAVLGNRLRDFAHKFKNPPSNPSTLNNPHALIVKRDAADGMVYLYDIKLMQEELWGTSDIPGIGTSTVANLENNRLLNRAFYDKVILDISMNVDVTENPVVTIMIDAFRDNGSGAQLQSKSRRESVTYLVNIGGYSSTGMPFTANVYNQGHNADGSPEFKSVTGASGAYDAWVGDYLILYNNVTATKNT